MSENNIVALIESSELKDFFGFDDLSYNVKHTFKDGSNPLTLTVKRSNLQNVKTLVQLGADVNLREAGGATPLLLAIYLKRLEIAEFLIKSGASVNIADSYETPLMMATRKGYLAIIELLVENGANINTPSLEGTSPLFWALTRDDFPVLTSLLKGGIPLHTKNSAGESPLIYAVKNGVSKEIIQCLLKNGAEINEAPLAWAAKTGQLVVLEILMEYGADGNVVGPDGNTPLAAAVRYDQLEVAEFLIKHGVNVCKVGPNGKTPLLWAVLQKNLDMMKFLLDHGADYIIDSVFLEAIATRNLEVVECLHERGAYKNKKYTISDVTPLAKALQVESYEIAEYLLKNGSTLDDLDNEIIYLLKFLTKKNYELVKLLTENGARLDQTCQTSVHTALTLSIEMEDFDMVRYFVEHNADLNRANKSRMTPLYVAARINDFRTFEFLVNEGADLQNDPMQNEEMMIQYYQKAKENISKPKQIYLALELLSNQEAADDAEEEHDSCEDEVKEKTLKEKNYYLIEFD